MRWWWRLSGSAVLSTRSTFCGHRRGTNFSNRAWHEMLNYVASRRWSPRRTILNSPTQNVVISSTSALSWLGTHSLLSTWKWCSASLTKGTSKQTEEPTHFESCHWHGLSAYLPLLTSTGSSTIPARIVKDCPYARELASNRGLLLISRNSVAPPVMSSSVEEIW